MTDFSPRSTQLLTILNDTAREAKSHTTRHIALGKEALSELGPWFSNTYPEHEAFVIADSDTYSAAGEKAAQILEESGVRVRRLVLEAREGDDHLVAEDGVILSLQTILASRQALVVAVGAGTVNDIGKYASFQLGREYIAVPTAASMNGYTSTIAAVLVKGVKRTLPCGQPQAIFADLDVLAQAPAVLNQAGFGDLMSKPVSHGDWLLSHLVRGVPYSSRPNDIIEELFTDLIAQAGAIGRNEPEGLHTLMEAILVSGFSMAVAGSSAPASGGEHLLSHYWDMEQLSQQKPLLALHGTQVGVATLLSAHLYQALLHQPFPLEAALSAAHTRRDQTLYLEGLNSRHPTLPAETVAEIRAQIAKKARFGEAFEAELRDIAARWPEIQAKLLAATMTPEAVEAALSAAGCPTRPSAIGCSPERAIAGLRVCHEIRDRYVALDLLADLGLLDALAAEVVQKVEAA